MLRQGLLSENESAIKEIYEHFVRDSASIHSVRAILECVAAGDVHLLD